MSSLSKQDVDTLFDEHLAKFPQLSEKINELRTLFATKMWH